MVIGEGVLSENVKILASSEAPIMLDTVVIVVTLRCVNTVNYSPGT